MKSDGKDKAKELMADMQTFVLPGKDGKNKEGILAIIDSLELRQECIVSSVMVALGKLGESYGSDAVECFQKNYLEAVSVLREAGEDKIFDVRKGLPSLTGASKGI